MVDRTPNNDAKPTPGKHLCVCPRCGYETESGVACISLMCAKCKGQGRTTRLLRKRQGRQT